MLYPFMTLPDETEIVHSESLFVDGKEKVKVVVERPVDYGFKSAICWLPEYKWEKNNGYSEAEMTIFRKLIQNHAHAILEFSKDGGVLNAANF